ncbi:MAG: EAL domain-containing protein, partial [Pseudomonadota bacterium]
MGNFMVINQEIQNEIDRIIRQEDLTAHFQPIVLLNKQSIFGYEGLIRGPSDSALHAPESLFNAAHQCGRLVELDILCRKIIIKQFGKLNVPGALFVNINPA